MSKAQLPFSWAGLAAGGLVFAATFLIGMWVTDSFRKGLDADMVHLWREVRLWELGLIIVVLALIASAWLMLARWIANWTSHPGFIFIPLVAGVPGLAVVIVTGGSILRGALEPPMNIGPWPPNNAFYLPNWLYLASVVGSFLGSALTYRSIARGTAAPRRA